MELKNVNLFNWKDKTFLTIREFIYLVAGYEPLPHGYEHLPDGAEEANFHLPNLILKDFYAQIKSLSNQLPKITEEINVQCCPASGELQYEIEFLMEWKEGWPDEISKNLPQNEMLMAFKKQTTRLDPKNALLSKFTSSYLYPVLIWIDENFYRDKESIAPADKVFYEIKEKYNKRDGSKIFLTGNDCKLAHNLMRIIYGLKK